MSTTPQPPNPPPHHPSTQNPDGRAAMPGRTLSLSRLLRRAVVGARGQKLGQLSDVIVRLRGVEYPLVTGLVAEIGGRRVFVPAELVTDWDTEQVSLSSARVDLRQFERRDGEVLLRTDILGHRLIDIPRARLVRAYDLELAQAPDGWVLAGVDTRKTSWWRRALGLGLAQPADDQHDSQGESDASGCRDWKAFEALIGHEPTVLLRTPTGRLRRLKPPQIADLLEQASRAEQTELLDQVHTDPELEADVFEELDDDRQSRLLRDRTDPDIAAVLARMRADDAADAIADLPQDRRHPVLELLPAGQRTKVIALLGYHPTSAGGLMGLDYLALPRDTTVAETLDRVRTAHTLQPEALITVFSLNDHGKLRGTASLVALIQADPNARLRDVADRDPIRVHPDADLVDITLLMTDYNLLNLPVVDDDDHLIGVITVDDALESTVPRNWRRREPPPHPDPDTDDNEQTTPTDPRSANDTAAAPPAHRG
jgi:CBS domain-containing protein/sporulation protein YlmC with PRC-barrel domain